jgi:C1A family cysteine protease
MLTEVNAVLKPSLMKSPILLLAIILSSVFLSKTLYGQLTPEEIPLNPAFVKQMNMKNQLKSLNREEGSFGLLPEPVVPHFSPLPLSRLKATLPERFDLRSAGNGGSSLLTTVKNQGNCGSCWSFAVMGAIEGYALKSGLGWFDLSENNLKECHGFVNSPCQGGNTTMATAYLANSHGPISEADDPYVDIEKGCTQGLVYQFQATKMMYLPKNSEQIKQAIMDYGALYTTMYYKSDYFRSANYTYYYNGSEGINHAVLIAGWDDTKSTSGGTGAWIVRNSWGPTWGQDGFFYVSYNDTRFNSNIMAIGGISAKLQNQRTFSYNEAGWISAIGYGENSAYGLVKFSSGTKGCTLKSVGSFIPSGGSVIGFELYSSFNGNTLSGLIGKVSNQNIDLPGYHSFLLDSPIIIAPNSTFFVKAFYNTPDYKFPIPFEKVYEGFVNPRIESGKCWISYSGTEWTALGSDTPYPYDLCVHVMAEEQNTLPDNLTVSDNTVQSGSSACYGAKNNLTLAGDNKSVVLKAGSRVNLFAGRIIRFLPGFYAQNGSDVVATITTNWNYCNENGGGGIDKPSDQPIQENFSKGVALKAPTDPSGTISIYPNPNSGSFTVCSKKKGESEIQVFSLSGFKVFGPLVFNERANIQMNTRAKGIYVGIIKNAEGVNTFKIEVK